MPNIELDMYRMTLMKLILEILKLEFSKLGFNHSFVVYQGKGILE